MKCIISSQYVYCAYRMCVSRYVCVLPCVSTSDVKISTRINLPGSIENEWKACRRSNLCSEHCMYAGLHCTHVNTQGYTAYMWTRRVTLHTCGHAGLHCIHVNTRGYTAYMWTRRVTLHTCVGVHVCICNLYIQYVFVMHILQKKVCVYTGMCHPWHFFNQTICIIRVILAVLKAIFPVFCHLDPRTTVRVVVASFY